MHALMLGLAAAAAVPTVTAETRTIAFELREGERLVAAPSLTVEVGRPAAIAGNGYGLGLAIERNGTSYLVRTALYRPAGTGWTLVAAPALTVVAGEQARISMGRAGYSLGVIVR